MAAVEAEPEISQEKLPGLLILTPDHGEHCHQFYDSRQLQQQYSIECALMKEYQVDMADYEVVILFGLTNEALGKLANGIFDTPFLKLAGEAILTGKRIFVPVEEVELYRYAATAPAPYYSMLLGRLQLLVDSGVAVVKLEDVEGCILDEKCCTAPVCKPCVQEEAREFRFTKRVITERDLAEAASAKACRVYVPCRSIVTDLAREFAKERDISLIRE